MEKDKSKWLSIGDASKYVGVSRDTLRRWEKAGKIKPIRSPTNRRYYTKKILDEAMMQKKSGRPANVEKKHSSKKASKMVISGAISFVIAVVLGILALLFLF